MVSKGEMKSELKQDDFRRGRILNDLILGHAECGLSSKLIPWGRCTVPKAGILGYNSGDYHNRMPTRGIERGIDGNFSRMPDMS